MPGVWAAGDCCQSTHIVSGRPVHEALGTVANKQGRVAGINIAGGYATFPGVAGTAVTRICALEIGRTGLSEREATEAGFAFVASKVTTTTVGRLPARGRADHGQAAGGEGQWPVARRPGYRRARRRQAGGCGRGALPCPWDG